MQQVCVTSLVSGLAAGGASPFELKIANLLPLEAPVGALKEPPKLPVLGLEGAL